MNKIPGITHLQNFTHKNSAKTADLEIPGLRNDLIIRAARGQQTERAPVWVMRQAGRYLPGTCVCRRLTIEFRKMREHFEFFECCRNPELASEITVQPIRRYEGLLDAAVIFSDILVVPQAMGLEVQMIPGKGPSFPHPLQTPKDMERLRKVNTEQDLGYVMDAIRLTRKKLKGLVPVIGFCGAPWTLMAYMIEGGGSKSWDKAKRWLFNYPEESCVLLQRIADECAKFLVAQICAGAQIIQVFDSWAGELSPADFRTFALPYLSSIAEQVRDHLASMSIESPPMIVYAKGALGHSIHEIIKSGYNVIGLDHTIEPMVARAAVKKARDGKTKMSQVAGTKGSGHPIVLQGNLDPAVLYAKPEVIQERVRRMFKTSTGGFGGQGALVCNLGHGITPGVDPENLRVFLEAVHKVSREVVDAGDLAI
mgnify:FL=1